jgi:hypothetical protein
MHQIESPSLAVSMSPLPTSSLSPEVRVEFLGPALAMQAEVSYHVCLGRVVANARLVDRSSPSKGFDHSPNCGEINTGLGSCMTESESEEFSNLEFAGCYY